MSSSSESDDVISLLVDVVAAERLLCSGTSGGGLSNSLEIESPDLA